MPPRYRRLVGATALILLSAGCHAGEPQQQVGYLSGCNYASIEGDPGLGAGFSYDETHHPFDTAVPVKLCWNQGRGDVLLTGTSPEIVVDPEKLVGEGPVFEFTVTVSPGATGGLTAQLMNERDQDSGSFDGPSIVVDETGWSFQPWGDDA